MLTFKYKEETIRMNIHTKVKHVIYYTIEACLTVHFLIQIS
jgi:hypothetical protein